MSTRSVLVKNIKFHIKFLKLTVLDIITSFYFSSLYLDRFSVPFMYTHNKYQKNKKFYKNAINFSKRKCHIRVLTKLAASICVYLLLRNIYVLFNHRHYFVQLRSYALRIYKYSGGTSCIHMYVVGVFD